MREYWITVSVPATSDVVASQVADDIADKWGGRVVDCTQEPPQGSTIVGDMHEDEL